MTALEVFDTRGCFCVTGSKRMFALEVFATDRTSLVPLLVEWGGQIIRPRPSHPRTWVWRLHGHAAESRWVKVREHMTDPARIERGDRKLARARVAR